MEGYLMILLLIDNLYDSENKNFFSYKSSILSLNLNLLNKCL